MAIDFCQIPFYVIGTLSTLGSISGDKTPLIDLTLEPNGKNGCLEINEPQFWGV